jgi:hypothetical protein
MAIHLRDLSGSFARIADVDLLAISYWLPTPVRSPPNAWGVLMGAGVPSLLDEIVRASSDHCASICVVPEGFLASMEMMLLAVDCDSMFQVGNGSGSGSANDWCNSVSPCTTLVVCKLRVSLLSLCGVASTTLGRRASSGGGRGVVSPRKPAIVCPRVSGIQRCKGSCLA